MPDQNPQMLSIWFWVGSMLLLFGLIITAVGVTHEFHPPNTVMGELNPALWWGIVMDVLGGLFLLNSFASRKTKPRQ